MITNFRTLLRLSVSHGYYSAACMDIDFVLSPDAAELMKNGKMLARVMDGSLYILFEADEDDMVLVPLPGERLRIWLRLVNPCFMNITDLDLDSRSALFYANSANAKKLDPRKEVIVTGELLKHRIAKKDRPVTVSLRDGSANVVGAEVVTDTDCTETQFLLGGRRFGIHTVLETTSASSSGPFSYYYDPGMCRSGFLGVVEIAIPGTSYLPGAKAPEMTIPFDEKKDRLHYYVVAKGHSQNEVDQISVKDNTLDASIDKIAFDRIEMKKIKAPYKDLGGENGIVVLFRSTEMISRKETLPNKLQLLRNDEPLIQSLPLPGPDKPAGEIIIHISK